MLVDNIHKNCTEQLFKEHRENISKLQNFIVEIYGCMLQKKPLGLELRTIDKVGKSTSIKGRTNTLLVQSFNWVLWMKKQNNT